MSRPSSELTHLFRAMKAPAAARALPKLAERAREEEWSYEQLRRGAAVDRGLLAGVLRRRLRIRAARFPAHKTLEEFDFTFQRSVKKQVIEHLGQLDFLHAKQNVILLGPPEHLVHTALLAVVIGQTVQRRALSTLILRPFRRPLMTWTACSSPRWTLCKTVWRAQPSRFAASIERQVAVGDVGHEPGADLVGEPDPPRRVRGGLLAGEQPGAEPSIDRGAA